MNESRASGGGEAEHARWQTALHEAGHTAACVAMGVPVRLVLIDGPGGGYCFYNSVADAFTSALIVAAGRQGEEYATTIKPPMHIDPKLPESNSPIVMELTRAIAETAKERSNTPDWVCIRDWACRGPDFSTWMPRVERIHSLAGRIVQLNMRIFVAIARELYVSSFINDTRIDELAAELQLRIDEASALPAPSIRLVADHDDLKENRQ